jgi:hypothetical protein
MTPSDRSPRPGEAGFVLIGVVIFVLALTIIGISLFSLSSYEAQFLQRSIDGEQAFQSAVGGIERAKFALAQTDSLPSVTENLPENVTAARAIQMQSSGPDSTGPVEWVPGRTVLIRVTTEVNGQRRTVEGNFDPGVAQGYYSQLVTVGGGIEVRSVGTYVPTDRSNTVYLGGTVWESSPQPTTTWTSILAAGPDSIQKSPLVPAPGTDAFFAQHYAASQPATKVTPGANPPRYRLDVGGPDVGYFRSPDESNTNYSLFEPFPGIIQIHVRGLAVWLLPRGIRFDYRPTISGIGSPGDDCLVIVAGRTGPVADPENPDAGIWFNGGLETEIPVILVSSEKVLIWHGNNHVGSETNTRADDIAIFARSLSLMGPNVGEGTVELRRQPGGPLDSRFLGQLVSDDALPDIGGSNGHHLTLIPGTWQASDR